MVCAGKSLRSGVGWAGRSPRAGLNCRTGVGSEEVDRRTVAESTGTVMARMDSSHGVGWLRVDSFVALRRFGRRRLGSESHNVPSGPR